ncbi:hypothetical protein G6F57_019919 [Rhizopus arrhizus]|nr:hypothetical protein G6F57_019919 [Rhizopus arrhizus]
MAPGPGRTERPRRCAGAFGHRPPNPSGRCQRKAGRLIHVSPAAPGPHHPGFAALRSGRAGALQPEPSAGDLPVARHPPGHPAAPAARAAPAPGARIAGPHFREVRAGAVHPPRPDPRRHRQRAGLAARPGAAVPVRAGRRLHRSRAGRAAREAVRAVRGGPGGLGLDRPGALRPSSKKTCRS